MNITYSSVQELKLNSLGSPVKRLDHTVGGKVYFSMFYKIRQFQRFLVNFLDLQKEL